METGDISATQWCYLCEALIVLFLASIYEWFTCIEITTHQGCFCWEKNGSDWAQMG